MPEVYQLKLSIRHISPMIWRRLLVRSDMTLDQLHDAIQILMNWDNYYLYQFKFFARQFSSRAGSCEDDSEVYLEDFQFHVDETFLYEYNFYCFWKVDIRLEKRVPFESNKRYPLCIAGKGDPPPEDIGGPADYMAWLDDRYSYDTLKAVDTLNEAVYPMLKAIVDNDEQAYYQARAEFKAQTDSEDYEQALSQYHRSAWYRDDPYKRRTINQQLKETFASQN